MDDNTELISDLALERVPEDTDAQRIAGARIITREDEHCALTDITITSEPAISVIGKPPGRYITVEITNKYCEDDYIADVLAEQIAKLVGRNIKTVLVAGLGNRHIPPDSLGARCVDSVEVTRLLNEYTDSAVPVSVAAVVPGVLGETGIEAAEIVGSVCDRLKPDIVMAVDALCAKDIRRIATTFQLTDTGISPGAGVKNMRSRIDEQALGCRVIGIGVPTVVYARTVCKNILQRVAEQNGMDEIDTVDEILESTDDYVKSLVVTPKDIDELSGRAAKIIAAGINKAFGE